MAIGKAQPQIANQTFLFGTAHEPQVSSWFSGCLVQDWDTEHDDLSSMPELKQFAGLVRLLYGEDLTKVTCVIGHKPKGVVLAKASGSYRVACKLTTATDYDTLEKLSRAAREHGQHYAPKRLRSLRDPDTGTRLVKEVAVRIKPWFWTGEKGECLLSINYGSKQIELQKGKTAIDVGTTDNLVTVLEKVITAVKNGELDVQIEAASSKLRDGFKK